MNRNEYVRMYEAEDSHWWYAGLHELILRIIRRESVRLGRPLQILDAGCGTGRLCQLMAAEGHSVEGCDASTIAFDYCSERGVKAFTCDLNSDSLEIAHYDVITLIDVIYHRNINNDIAVLRNIYSSLKPDGILILQVPAYTWLWSPHDEAVHTARRYTRKTIRRMILSCGFSIEKDTYRVTLLFIPIVLMRLMKKIAGRSGKVSGSASDVKKHSPFLNAVLYMLIRAENSLLAWSSLSFGTSVFAVAQKPCAPDRSGGAE